MTQAKVSEAELGWLAGIIDGEGCIYGHWTNRGRYSTGGSVSVEIRVEVTSFAMIAKVAQLCELLDVRFTVDERLQPKATKPSRRINIRRRKDVLRFLTVIRNYLVVKQQEADLAIQYYQRQERPDHDVKVVFFDTLSKLKKTA